MRRKRMNEMLKIDYVCDTCGRALFNTDSFVDGDCDICGGSLKICVNHKRHIDKPLIDPKTLGVPNICFSLTDENEDHFNRSELFRNQRITRGFDDSETWSLDHTIAKFIIPRLERYIELSDEILDRSEEEINDIIKFLTAMKLHLKLLDEELSEDELLSIEDGLSVFPKIFGKLWW
jgi:hypothetical protein